MTSIFHPILLPFWCQNGTKMAHKSSQNPSNLSTNSCKRFSIDFVTLLDGFLRCPTLNLTAIYSTFVGSGLFRNVRKGTQNDHPKCSKTGPKTIPKPSKKQSQNEASKYDKKKGKSSSCWKPFGLPFGTLGASLGSPWAQLELRLAPLCPSCVFKCRLFGQPQEMDPK